MLCPGLVPAVDLGIPALEYSSTAGWVGGMVSRNVFVPTSAHEVLRTKMTSDRERPLHNTNGRHFYDTSSSTICAN